MDATLLYNGIMITVEDFKIFFNRDFPYLPIHKAEQEYQLDEEVCDADGKRFYISLVDDNSALLTDENSWQRIKDDMYNYVLDEDIEKNIKQAEAIIPDQMELRMPDDVYELARYFLSAHLLVDNIRTSNAGLTSQINAITTGKSVGSISQQYGIPTTLLNDAASALFITSQYGLRYLSLLMPYLNGQVCIAAGATTP